MGEDSSSGTAYLIQRLDAYLEHINNYNIADESYKRNRVLWKFRKERLHSARITGIVFEMGFADGVGGSLERDRRGTGTCVREGCHIGKYMQVCKPMTSSRNRERFCWLTAVGNSRGRRLKVRLCQALTASTKRVWCLESVCNGWRIRVLGK